MGTPDVETFTQFPDLGSTVSAEEPDSDNSISWQFDAFDLPKEIIVLSWAALLSSFTEVSEPVFTLDGKPVKVDLVGRTCKDVEIEDTQQRRKYTALWIEKASSFTHQQVCRVLI